VRPLFGSDRGLSVCQDIWFFAAGSKPGATRCGKRGHAAATKLNPQDQVGSGGGLSRGNFKRGAKRNQGPALRALQICVQNVRGQIKRPAQQHVRLRQVPKSSWPHKVVEAIWHHQRLMATRRFLRPFGYPRSSADRIALSEPKRCVVKPTLLTCSIEKSSLDGPVRIKQGTNLEIALF